jgi:hypothetical protein
MKNDNRKHNIVIDNKMTEIIQLDGRLFFSLEVHPECIKDYQRRVFENHISPFFMTMRFLNNYQGMLSCYYDFGGYIQLKDMYRIWKEKDENLVSQSIGILLATMGAINSIENYLFTSRGFLINEDVIFINNHTGRVKLAFVPEPQSELSIYKKLDQLISYTVLEACNEEWNYYADKIQEIISAESESPRELEKKLKELGREASSLCWPKKSALISFG